MLRLDFGTLEPFASAEDFSTAFDALITAAADDAGLEIPRDAGGPIARLAKWIAAREDASLVLLIDDYDAPFLRAWKDEKLFAEAEAQLGRFYAYLKSMEEKFRFLFITGTTRVTGAWLTSPMNGLQDVTFDPAYAALAGFTEDEFETAFRVRLNRAAKAKRVTRGELVGTVCGQCGGYSFDEAASTRLRSPEAAMTFLLTVAGGFAIRPKPLDEAQDLLDHLLGKADCRLFNGDLVMPMDVLVERVGPGDASPAALAFQLGFLTVGERVTPSCFVSMSRTPRRCGGFSNARLRFDRTNSARGGCRPFAPSPVSRTNQGCAFAVCFGRQSLEYTYFRRVLKKAVGVIESSQNRNAPVKEERQNPFSVGLPTRERLSPSSFAQTTIPHLEKRFHVHHPT